MKRVLSGTNRGRTGLMGHDRAIEDPYPHTAQTTASAVDSMGADDEGGSVGFDWPWSFLW